MRLFRWSTAFLLLVTLVGCGANPKSLGRPVVRTPLPPAALLQHQQLVGEGDALWAERLDETKLRGAIAKWSEAVKVKPDDHETYTKLARACYLLADGFLSFVDGKVEEFLATHEQGLGFAEQGLLALSPDFEKRRQGGTEVEDAVMVLGREAVPLLYWYDVNLGKWAKFQGIVTTLKHKDRIFKIMTHVYNLDPDYFHGAPDRYFGAFYAVAPAFAGGDLEKSHQYFERSVKKAPHYLATHVLIAENYAPKVQDRALFERELKFVLDTPPDSLPDVLAEQTIEKRKAERLLKQIEEKF